MGPALAFLGSDGLPDLLSAKCTHLGLSLIHIYAGFALANAAWQTWLLFAVYGLYLGMSQGVLLAMVADKVPEDQRGTAFGFVNLATGITLLPASLVAGMLWDKVSPAAPFLLGAAFALLAALFLIIGLKLTEPIDKTA